jgi:hypothetical protein
MFIRFLIADGHCAIGFEAAIPTVAHWRLAALPRYICKPTRWNVSSRRAIARRPLANGIERFSCYWPASVFGRAISCSFG